MDKTNIEVKEQLLKDLAANIGYELIPEPFTTPFEEASIERLPDYKRFFWPVPASVLNDNNHKDFRKTCIEADVVDSVCITSFAWPSDENERVAILLIDVTRKRRGSVKFVDASRWDLTDETGMAAVCNLLIHDLFPGEGFLAFQMNENAMDEGLDFPWNEQVCIIASCDVKSLHPSDYLHKLGYGTEGMCIVADVFDVYDSLAAKNIVKLDKPALLLSTIGNLSIQIIKPGDDVENISLESKMLLVPNDGYHVDLDFALQLFRKEEVLRQLPITRRITWNDMWRVQIGEKGLYTQEHVSFEDLLSRLNVTSDKD